MIQIVLGENVFTKISNISIFKSGRLIATVNVTDDEISITSNCIKSFSKDFDPMLVVRSDSIESIEGFHLTYGDKNKVKGVST